MKAKLVKVEAVARNIKTFWFKPQTSVRYTAGQFTQIDLPHDAVDNRGTKRWFTLSSSPTEELLAITTKITPDFKSSFKTHLSQLKLGSVVYLAEPIGDFVLPKDPSIDLVFVAGGIGITPYRSMIRYLIDQRQTRNVRLIYAIGHRKEMAFLKLFNDYPTIDLTIFEGGLTGPDILKITGDVSTKRIYLSGPEPLVEILDKELIELGVNRQLLQTDFFSGYLHQ